MSLDGGESLLPHVQKLLLQVQVKSNYYFFLCWSSYGEHFFWTPSKSYISVSFTHNNYKFMPWCVYCKVFLFILITHVCESRDHINIEHAYSGYSLPKRDSIHRVQRCKLQLNASLTPLHSKPLRLDKCVELRFSILSE